MTNLSHVTIILLNFVTRKSLSLLNSLVQFLCSSALFLLNFSINFTKYFNTRKAKLTNQATSQQLQPALNSLPFTHIPHPENLKPEQAWNVF